MATQSSLLAKSGIGQLTSILETHLQLIQKKDAAVEQIISTAQTADSLREAKKKALQNEKDLLLSIMEDIGEMNLFLNNIVLIENLFNSMYQPFKQKQEESRLKYASNISKYENKAKVQSNASSFVELIFNGQTHVSSFQTWLDKVVKQCKIQKVSIKDNSGAKVKKIERAFYKSFYVYSQQNGHKDMTDILRCSFVFTDFEDLYKCFSIIELMADDSLGGILRVKDRFHPNTVPFGYRDLLINILCPGSKIIAEIQLHFVEFFKYKKISHKMYKRARLFERDNGNLAYEYATKFMRPKIGSFKVYEASKDEIDDDDDKESETVASQMKYDELLKAWGLEIYIDKMKGEGWDDIADWRDLEDNDLKNDMGFSKGHIKRFRRRYQEWLKQTEDENKTDIIDDTKTEQKRDDAIYNKQQQSKPIHSVQRKVLPSKQIPPSDALDFERAIRNGWKCFPGQYLGGYTRIGAKGLTLSEAIDKCFEIEDAAGINIQYNDNEGKLWTLRKGKVALSASGYDKDNLCCLLKPEIPSKQIPSSDVNDFGRAISNGWKCFPAQYLAGYTDIGAKGLTLSEAINKCRAMEDAAGINIQWNDNGGKLWTLRRGKEPTSASGYHKDNLCCIVKPLIHSKQVPLSDLDDLEKAVSNGWKYCPGRYLAGYTSIGAKGLTMAQAIDKCLSMSEAEGINIQYNDNGGKLWTLRKGKEALSASGYDKNNLCCLIKPAI